MCNTTSLFNFLGSRNPVSRLKGKNHIFHSEFPEICLAVNSGRKTEMDDLDFSERIVGGLGGRSVWIQQNKWRGGVKTSTNQNSADFNLSRWKKRAEFWIVSVFLTSLHSTCQVLMSSCHAMQHASLILLLILNNH